MSHRESSLTDIDKDAAEEFAATDKFLEDASQDGLKTRNLSEMLLKCCCYNIFLVIIKVISNYMII